MRLCHLLPALAISLPGVAQGPEAAAFERDLRNQKTAMLLVVDDGKGGWMKPLEQLRREDGFLDLGLSLNLRGKEELLAHLQERHGLGPRPFWAVFAKGRLVASGKQPPTLAGLRNLKDQAAWRSAEDILRDFLRANPDHREARLRLLTALYQKAALRTQIAMALRIRPLEATDQGWDAARMAKENEEAVERKRKEDDEAKPVKLFEPEEDERIWGPFAAEWTRAFQAEEWKGWEWTAFDAEYMRHSPRMKSAFKAALPDIETVIHQWPERWNAWQLWLQASEVLGGLPLRRLLDDLTPNPLSSPERWPPHSVRQEYVKDCRRRKDWAAIRDILLPQWESELLWKSREKTRYAMVQDGKEVPSPWSASEWRESREPLVEALLRLGETLKADEIVRALVADSLSGDLASRASALATKCGHPALAVNWAQLQPGKAH